jgi:hypothetical protein
LSWANKDDASTLPRQFGNDLTLTRYPACADGKRSFKVCEMFSLKKHDPFRLPGGMDAEQNICAALSGDYPVQTVTITFSHLRAKYKHRDKTIL